MNADRIVYGVLMAMALWWLGWETRGWHEANQPKPLNVRPAPIRVTRAQVTLPCPVTKRQIEEFYRGCRAQQRSESISKGEIR